MSSGRFSLEWNSASSELNSTGDPFRFHFIWAHYRLGLFDPLLSKIPWPMTGLMGLGALTTVIQLPNVAVIS